MQNSSDEVLDNTAPVQEVVAYVLKQWVGELNRGVRSGKADLNDWVQDCAGDITRTLNPDRVGGEDRLWSITLPDVAWLRSLG